MVKTVMSSDNSEPEEPDILVKTKGKILIQRSLIDSHVRTLQRLKESTSRLISTCSNSSSSSLTNGESQSAIDDDIMLQEVETYLPFISLASYSTIHISAAAHCAGYIYAKLVTLSELELVCLLQACCRACFVVDDQEIGHVIFHTLALEPGCMLIGEKCPLLEVV